MLIRIDFESVVPIYTQLKDQIVIGIANGSLKPNEALPSVRRMSADIGIHAHTVNKSYAILRDEGYIIIDRRSGCRVADKAPKSDQRFLRVLEAKMEPFAAEAVCHGISESEFSDMCTALFREIKYGKIASNEETKEEV